MSIDGPKTEILTGPSTGGTAEYVAPPGPRLSPSTLGRKSCACVCLPHRFSGRIKIGRARSVAPICVDADAMKTKVV